MARKSQQVDVEYDLKSTELPEGADYIGHSGGAYFFAADQCHYAFNKQLDCIQKISVPCRCRVVSRFDQAVILAVRNRLYHVDRTGAISDHKFKKRLLYVRMVSDREYIQVLICRDRKVLQVQLGEQALLLEMYPGKCDCEVLFADFVDRNMFCLAYLNEGTDVKIALIGLGDGNITLLRSDLFRQAKMAKMSRAVGCNDAFLLRCDNELNFMRYDPLYCVMTPVRQLNLDEEQCSAVRLVDHERMFKLYVEEGALRLVFCGATVTDTVEVSIPVDGKSSKILAVNSIGGDVGVLFKVDAKHIAILQFRPPSLSGKPIFFDNKLNVDRPTDELCTLIRTGMVTLNSQLVDHVMSNKLRSCAIECLKSIYIPEKEAIRIVVKDTSLLKVLIQHTKGDEREMIMAIRHHVSCQKCAEIIDMLFVMLDNIEEFGDDQMHCYKRIIAFINLLLDAKLFQLQESNMFKKEWIDRLQTLVEHCTTENYNLQSLLSFTTSLLKSRRSKHNNDQNSLTASFPISV